MQTYLAMPCGSIATSTPHFSVALAPKLAIKFTHATNSISTTKLQANSAA